MFGKPISKRMETRRIVELHPLNPPNKVFDKQVISLVLMERVNEFQKSLTDTLALLSGAAIIGSEQHICPDVNEHRTCYRAPQRDSP